MVGYNPYIPLELGGVDDDSGGRLCVDRITFWWRYFGTKCEEEDNSRWTESGIRMATREDYLRRYSSHYHGLPYRRRVWEVWRRTCDDATRGLPIDPLLFVDLPWLLWRSRWWQHACMVATLLSIFQPSLHHCVKSICVGRFIRIDGFDLPPHGAEPSWIYHTLGGNLIWNMCDVNLYNVFSRSWCINVYLPTR